MTDPSLGKKKKKITIIASPQGVEMAKKALTRMGFDSKANFAKSLFMSRSTVTKFFQGEPIQLDSFKRICEPLKLNWGEVADLTEEQPNQLPISSPGSKELVEQVQPEQRQVTVIDRQSRKIKLVITLKGDINSVENLTILQSVLREYSGDTIAITDIKEGSIRLFVEGSPEDIERLVSSINSGELKEVEGFPVEDVQILSESSNDESTESDEKWRLVQEIVSLGAILQDLSDADLSDADLSGAHLFHTNLSCADLSGANLSGANLSGANLSCADLSGADLSGADLNRAYLSDANLSNANLNGANLSDASLSRAYLSDANLNGADLNGANLRDAKLIGANLIGANLYNFVDLSGADLSNANLSNANLSNANLSFANLSFTDLSNANFTFANLKDANLKDATVVKAMFDTNPGLTEDTKRDLEQRGAIFSDRPPVLNLK